MPKKTRREKILAQSRRSIQDRPSNQYTSPATAELELKNNLPYSFQSNTIKNTLPTKMSLFDQTELHAIRKDLVKTVILVCIAVFIEIIVSIYLRKMS